MRLKLFCKSKKPNFIPFNYQYQLHSAIYNLIRKSSAEYSGFLHDTGFIDNNKHLKLFTFSKLQLDRKKIIHNGFKKIKELEFYFSTPISKSFEHIVLGIFSDQKLALNFGANQTLFEIINVETLPEPLFSEKKRFTCFSPIAISTMQQNNANPIQHYLDYLNPDERDHFILNLKNNLIRKYKLVHKQEFTGKKNFEFSFDPVYITKRKGKISKLIDFKKGIKIKAM